MIVYAVFMEGVYRHDCCGIFTHLHTAVQCAIDCATNDDAYHDYDVVEIEMEKIRPTETRVFNATKQKKRDTKGKILSLELVTKECRDEIMGEYRLSDKYPVSVQPTAS